MQENNNFETIISTWRRLSGELVDSKVETSDLSSMSGDSSSHQPFKKKEDDAVLVPERPKGPIATAASAGMPIATAASAGVAIASVEPQHDHAETQTPDDDKQEKHELIKYDREDSKEAAGDMAKEDTDEKSFLENESITSKSHDNKWEKGDKVDSVYLRPPPPHKVRSNASSNDDDDCGIKCLYYTLQCCDCVLM